MSVDGRTRLGTNTELLLKLGTAALGTLYVFGILVSNVQLMEVGISDFTSLQVRNVMTGFLFVFYLVCRLLLLDTITMAFYLCLHVAIRPTLSFPQKLWRTLCNVVLMTHVAGGIVYFL